MLFRLLNKEDSTDLSDGLHHPLSDFFLPSSDGESEKSDGGQLEFSSVALMEAILGYSSYCRPKQQSGY